MKEHQLCLCLNLFLFYSKIYGGIFVSEDFKFMTMVFNPKKNDANLEFDTRRNLRRKTSGILLP